MKKLTIIIALLVFLIPNINSQQHSKRTFPSIWLNNTKPLPTLELPKNLKKDSILGRVIFQLSVSAKSLKINKFAILNFRLTNKSSGKEIFEYTQLKSSAPTDYNWNHYPLMVREYKSFLFENIMAIKFKLDYSSDELKESEWQLISGVIEFK
jgi:isopentenyldiphosphate isomerase